MSKTIYFKPEFESKLKQLKIKTKFVNNLRIALRTIENKDDRMFYLNTADNFSTFVKRAFVWSVTPEEYDFWDIISILY